jgi:amino acid adenylation domain-containing protein
VGAAAETAERFVPDPFGEAGARLYRSGDQGRWCGAGELEYLGRMDEQVKLRGQRIELGEIEGVLREQAGVKQAAVVVRGGERLVAYVAGEGIGSRGLRRALAERLPEWMRPTAVVVVEEWPLTENGKLDRERLPEGEGEREWEAPRGAVEEMVAGIWEQVLGRERIGRGEDFFELGGHSLLATQVMSRLRQLVGVELALRVAFEAPTVAEMAERVEEARGQAGGKRRAGVQPVGRQGSMPMSFAQQRLWFVEQLAPGSATYHMGQGLRLRGRLDVAALGRSLAEVERRHEALRTSFGMEGGEAVQRIGAVGGLRLVVADVQKVEASRREPMIGAVARRWLERPYDLERGPLARTLLLRLSGEEHVLVVGMHHLISDAWSIGVLTTELTALYAAYREGRELELPELAVQYADYAVWQREGVGEEEWAEQLGYWREQLAGVEPLPLPADRRRPAAAGHRGAEIGLRLGAAQVRALRALSRSQGVTLFMTLLAAWQVLLARFADSTDVVVGASVANRDRVEIERVMGLFVNMLVLRSRVDWQGSFGELLQQVRGTVLEGRARQDVPFEKIVEELRPERHLSRTPLFQVAFTLDNASGPDLRLAGLELEAVRIESSVAKFDLVLFLEEGADTLGGALIYSAELFERSSVERLAGHFERLLEVVSAEPKRALGSLEWMSGAERAQILEGWNGTARPYPEVCVHELVGEQASQRPDAIAVSSGERQLSYGALWERAGRLQGYLERLGIGAENRVAICLERGLEVMVAMVGVLRAGACYVPVDPQHPQGRLDAMLADAAPDVVLTEANWEARLPAGMWTVRVDGDAELWAEEAEAEGDGVCWPDQLAYLMYTSGSTGTPKGVMIAHRGIVRLVRNTDYLDFRAEDHVGQVANLSFDAAAFETWGALMNGARLEILNKQSVLDAGRFAEELEALRIDVMLLTSSLFHQHVREQPEMYAGLRRLVVGAEVVDPGAARRVLGGRGPGRLLNAYGPTENSVISTWFPIDNLELDAASVPIGRPIANSTAYVVDDAGRLSPPGTPGELWAGGDGLARGYWRNPVMTAERFVPDPFTGKAGARLYRTGDRARWLSDGSIEFLGRRDVQVKVRGYRIELGEVEAALRAQSGVREAAVVAQGEDPGKWLVAYVVPANGQTLTAERLRKALETRLPDYMTPGAFVFLEALPLTPSGKLDRRALPDPQWSENSNYVAPRTALETLIADIWSEVLAVGRVGIRDNFFDLSGHSLLAARVVARIRHALDLELPIYALFNNPTIEGLAAILAEPAVNGLRPIGQQPIQAVTGEQFSIPIENLTEDDIDVLINNASER